MIVERKPQAILILAKLEPMSTFPLPREDSAEICSVLRILSFASAVPTCCSHMFHTGIVSSCSLSQIQHFCLLISLSFSHAFTFVSVGCSRSGLEQASFHAKESAFCPLLPTDTGDRPTGSVLSTFSFRF